MNAFRCRLASGALALIVLQFALLFAAPVSACCQSGALRVKAAVTVDQDVECCPPGSHPPGQCPRHKNKDRGSRTEDRGSKAEPRASACRMMCDAPHGPQFVLGVVGVVGAPQSMRVDLIASALPAGAASTTTARPSLPDAPPPRLL